MTVIIWGLDRFVRWGGGRWDFVDIQGRGFVVQEIESPDFRSPKVGISEMRQPVAEPKAASVIQAPHPPPPPQPQPTPPGLKILAQITNPHFENLIKE